MARLHSESTARDMYLYPFGRVAGVSYLAIACVLASCDPIPLVTDVVEPYEPSNGVSNDLRQHVFGDVPRRSITSGRVRTECEKQMALAQPWFNHDPALLGRAPGRLSFLNEYTDQANGTKGRIVVAWASLLQVSRGRTCVENDCKISE